MKNIFTRSFIVGFFIVISVCVFIYFMLKTEEFNKKTYTLKTSFNYAGGLKENAMVALAGIEIGRVSKIAFTYEPETKVILTLEIDDIAKIHEDSICYIGTQGFIGDVFIGITPGKGSMAFLKSGQTIKSEDPIEMRKLMEKADTIADNLNTTLVDVKELVNNINDGVKDNRQNIDNIISNIERTTVNFNEFSEDIKAHPWKLLMKGKDDDEKPAKPNEKITKTDGKSKKQGSKNFASKN
ncbi:MAG: MlaD family protein [Candidatus Omnitrophica bacterium]|nr:MlaD family protein [Candidatus Omnitrophota bacterium]